MWWIQSEMDRAATAYEAAHAEAEQHGITGERATCQAQRAFVLAFTDPAVADDELEPAQQLLAGLDLRATGLTTQIAALVRDAGITADIEDRASILRTEISVTDLATAEATLELAMSFHYAVQGAHDGVTSNDVARLGTATRREERPMAEAVVPEVRAAQRRIVGTVRASGVLNNDGLALWREADCEEWKATAAEIGKDLELLEVPYTIVTAFRFPLASSWNKAMRRGEEVRIARKDVIHLVRWMPSLKESIDDIPEDGPGWAFRLFQPRAEGMAICNLALSADWPTWSKKQARAAGLVCAECDYDLRQFKDEERLPYDIRLPERPKKRRLLCGQCCEHGLKEMERLAVLAEKPS
ncbi:hypothetical protein [Streptomyces coffeae]|uniref:Uncharacterized protein n=1 Tax=Streptomyces coffeae TaxID=621382 RepID=A0ABS1NRU8_9ACTN|nr:hypothetical protein [Streptomyces coffeae]MBL1102461.1 hypothetical protein [Streptomyces coffeae]